MISSVTAGLSTAVLLGVLGIVAVGIDDSAQPPPVLADSTCSDVAPSAAEAQAMASSCQQRVEDLSARTESSQTFVNADGTSTTELSVTPERIRRSDGSWATIDPTLRLDDDGLIRPTVSTVDVAFSSGGTGPLVTMVDGQRQFTMSWPGTLPTPSLSADTATYAEVLPGVDLIVRATGSGFTHVLEVKNAQAAMNSSVLRICYPLGFEGASAEGTEGGGYAVIADDGSVLMRSGGAVMWDSSAAETIDVESDAVSGDASAGNYADQEPVTSGLDGDTLVIEPDAAVLSQATYPVFIDPQWMDPTTPSRWAYANSANETNDTTWARAGKDPESGAIYRSLFEFGTSGLSGARIISATFKITLYHSYSCASSPTPMRLWRTATIASTPRAAWSSASLVQELDTQSASANKDSCAVADTPDMNFSGTLASDLQSAVDGGGTSYTVGLAAATSTSGANESTASWWKKFYANSARLIVYYNKAPTAPAAADMSIAPSFTCGLTAIQVNGLNGLTLRAKLSDPDGDNVTAQWLVTGIDASYAPADSAPAASGGVFKTTIPAAALTDGNTYTWRVRGTDGTDVGAYGAECAFTIDNSLPGDPIPTSVDLAMVTEEPAPAALATAVVGQAATVTLSPATEDTAIAGYLIGVGAGAPAAPVVWIPASGDGTAEASVIPVSSGDTTNYLTVTARNRAGQTGGTVTYVFRAQSATAGTTHVAADATGDGRADITTLADIGNGQSALWRWNATTAGTLASAIAPQDVLGAYTTGSTKIVQGDFDGDGLADVATFTQVGSDVVLAVQRSNGNALVGTQVKTLTGWSLSSVTVVAANFDADTQQRDDIAVFYDEGGYIFTVRMLLASGGSGAPAFADPVTWWTQPASGGASISNMKIFAGDFDGDGLVDVGFLYQYDSCQTKMWVQYSTGTAFGYGTMVWDSGANNWCWANSDVNVGDFDADGYSDVAILYYYAGCDTQIWMIYGAANRTVSAPAVAWASGAGQWCDKDNETHVGDITGDGKADLAVVLHCCGTYQAKVVTFASTGRSFAAPVFQWEGGLGPVSSGSLSIDPTATYQIVNLNSGKCLAVLGGDGTQLSQQTCDTSASMTFTLTRGTAVHLTLIHPSQSPTSCVEIANSSLVAGAAVRQAACSGQTNQRYQITYLSGFTDPVVTITSEVSGLNFDIPNSSTADGALIWQYTPNGTSAQQFYLRAVA